MFRFIFSNESDMLTDYRSCHVIHIFGEGC
uniref:Uncharacterized protein n=1 Tax=Leclercia adecarboxylata TaxID=83655 RepID=A0A7D5JZ44_9ENTR|nr:hypothetical protein [Leclercia adecarboxylata]